LFFLIHNIIYNKSGGIEFPEFLKIATSKLSDKDSREDIEKVFNYYDWDGSGKITVNELKKIAEYLGEEMTEEELVAMFAKADLDNDGFVTKEDFYNIMTGNGYY
jgi:centrin-1